MKVLFAAIAITAIGLVAGFAARSVTDDGGSSPTLLAASVTDCPGGSIVTTYSAGSRVFAIARTDDSAWVQVRELSAPDNTVWLRAEDVELDDGIADLPVSDCPRFDDMVTVGALETSSTTTTTTPEVTTTTVSGTTSTTGATTTTTSPDTTPPTISQSGAVPDEIWEEDADALSCPASTPHESTISAGVTDTGGVSTVTASWTIGGAPDQVTMARSGSVYSVTFGPFPYPTIPGTPNSHPPEDVIVTIRALDAAGNAATAAVTVRVQSLLECLG